MKISNKVKVLTCALAMALAGAMAFTPVFADNDATKATQYTGTSQTGVAKESGTVTSTVNTVINVAIGIIGLLAVIMIIVGGFQYTTSSGDSGKVTKAKNTILYGVIGLVIALLAYAIVNFVLKSVFNMNV